MSKAWLVVVDSAGFMARVTVYDDAYDLEWRTYKGAWERAAVTQADVDSVDATIGAILALHMYRNECVSDRDTHHFVIWSRCREIAIGYRFYDDGKYRWHVSDGYIPDEKEQTYVPMHYHYTSDSMQDALSAAIGLVLSYVRKKDCGESRDE